MSASMLSQKQAIGFMDSGLGGLSVLQAAIRLMPAEDYIYYGDSLHAPYGTKTPEDIRRLTFSAAETLLAQGIKGLVIACNTATSAAIRPLREQYPFLPIIGIEPAIKPAVLVNQGGQILVLATPMTIRQEKYQHLLDLYKDSAEIISIPCEGLMEFVEQGILCGPELDAYWEAHLLPLLSEKTETIVLGCTHYPFLKQSLKAFLHGRPVNLIDGSRGTALELKRQLQMRSLLRPSGPRGRVTIQNSAQQPQIIELCHRLLASPI